MRKLLLFFAMLSVSIGAWAYSGSGDGITLSDEGSDVQKIEITSPGALKAWYDGLTDDQRTSFASNTNRTKLVISGSMNAADFSAITGDMWSKFVEVDLSGVSVTSASDIKGIGLTNATKIKLPGACADYAKASSTMWPNAEWIVGYENGGTLGIYTKTAGNVRNALQYYGAPFGVDAGSEPYQWNPPINNNVTPANLKLSGSLNWIDFNINVAQYGNDYAGSTDSNGNAIRTGGLYGLSPLTLTGYVDFSDAVFSDETYTKDNWGNITTTTKTVDDCWMQIKDLFPANGSITNPGSQGATELKLPTNPAYTTIPANLMFGGDNGNNMKSSLKVLNIPENYTKIEHGAFAYCNGLESLFIPQSVSSICPGATEEEQTGTSMSSLMGAFQGCASLTDVVFEDRSSELHFGPHTFQECTGLKHINLPAGTSRISKYMFSHCSSLDAIRIAETVTLIDDGAFEYCTSLQTIAIPGSVQAMGHKVFYQALITDVYLMATSIDEIPTIYSMGPNVATGRSDATFNANSMNANNTAPSVAEMAGTSEKFTDEVEQQYRNELTGGNTITYLHYNENLRDFIDPNPWKGMSNAEMKLNDANFWDGAYTSTADAEAEKLRNADHLSDSYGYGPDKQDRLWVSADHGDYVRCTAMGSPEYSLVSGEAYPTAGQEPSKIGWRQFVLKSGFDADNPEDHFAGNYDDTWYTMCFPFDVTNNQLAGAFNPGYNLCEFTGAAITTDASGKEAVAFMFTRIPLATYTYEGTEYNRKADASGRTLKDDNGNNIYVLKGTTSEITKSNNPTLWAALEDVDGVMAVAGHPYMIHPDKVATPGNPQECVIQNVSYIDHYNVLKDDDPDKATAYQKIKQIYLDQAVTLPISTMTESSDGSAEISATKKVTLTDSGNGSYTFIGRFLPKKETVTSESIGYLEEYDGISPYGYIPNRSYFLGVEGSNHYPKYYRQTASDTYNEGRTKGFWSQFTAIIIPDEAAKAWENGTTPASGAKSINVDFCEVEMVDATTIKKVVEDAEARGENVKYMNVIVTIDGKVVRRDTTSIEGLPSGIYIVNGKKYLVK